MEGKITAEWERLHKVIVHRPGIEMFFGLLDPSASLYERAFSQSAALKEHDNLTNALRSQFKVDVRTLRDEISRLAERNGRAKELLVDTGLSHVEFVGDKADVASAKRDLKRNIDTYDSDYFLNIMLLMPRMVLRKGSSAAAVHINVTERDPLANLYFMRDQQAVTDKGIFLSRMSKPQRRPEPKVTRMLWEMMGLPIAHESTAPGTFEGGDFMPMKDFALIGCGDRTNANGAAQMLSKGQSFDEVAMVHQPTHPLMPSNVPDPMIDMHLDTYFNVAGSGIVIGSELLLKRAKVEIYKRHGTAYRMESKKTNLHDYIKSKGFNIINLSTLEQMSYATNFLCIKDRTILAIESDLIVKKVLENLSYKAKANGSRYGALFSQVKKEYGQLRSSGQIFPHKKEMKQNGIDLYSVDLQNITGGYGGAHCMTAVISRG